MCKFNQLNLHFDDKKRNGSKIKVDASINKEKYINKWINNKYEYDLHLEIDNCLDKSNLPI